VAPATLHERHRKPLIVPKRTARREWARSTNRFILWQVPTSTSGASLS
jgi:hypothetical protein